MKTIELNWTKIGTEYHESKEAVINTIEGLEWIDIIENMYLSKQDHGITLPFTQGEGIKSAIKEFKIPKVSHIAYNGMFNHCGNTLGLYGIYGHYKNADVKLYFVDSGDCLTPICTEVYNKEGA